MAVIYLAHPLGTDRINNPRRALKWLAFLMSRERYHAIMCPWLPFVEVEREEGIPEIDPLLYPLDHAFQGFPPGDSIIEHGKRRWPASALAR